jgi:hypothetical protein
MAGNDTYSQKIGVSNTGIGFKSIKTLATVEKSSFLYWGGCLLLGEIVNDRWK